LQPRLILLSEVRLLEVEHDALQFLDAGENGYGNDVQKLHDEVEVVVDSRLVVPLHGADVEEVQVERGVLDGEHQLDDALHGRTVRVVAVKVDVHQHFLLDVEHDGLHHFKYYHGLVAHIVEPLPFLAVNQQRLY